MDRRSAITVASLVCGAGLVTTLAVLSCSDRGEVDQSRGNAAIQTGDNTTQGGGATVTQGGGGGGSTAPVEAAAPPFDLTTRNPWKSQSCDMTMDAKYSKCNACICSHCNDYKGDIAGQGQMGETHALYFATECMKDTLCPQILDCAQKTHCDGNSCPMKGDGGCGDIILPHATERGAGLAWSIGTDCLAPGINCLAECGPPGKDAGHD